MHVLRAFVVHIVRNSFGDRDVRAGDRDCDGDRDCVLRGDAHCDDRSKRSSGTSTDPRREPHTLHLGAP